jgi:membrane protein required for colicin V production
MNLLDVIVIAVIVLSGLFAFVRGFVKETLSIAGWLGATAAAIYAMPYARPVAERFLPKGAAADAAAAGLVFFATLIVLSILTSAISRRVKRSALSALDRTLGLVFGLVRGALVVALGYIALSFVLPQVGAKPSWVTESRTLPLVASATQSLTRLLPGSLRRQVAKFSPEGKIESDYLNALRAYSVPGAPASAGPPAIAPQDQERLDQLIKQIGANPDTPGLIEQQKGKLLPGAPSGQ